MNHFVKWVSNKWLLSLIVLLLIIVIVIIKQIVIINGMIMGTIVGWDKSFRRQRTRDRWGLLPSTPPPLCVVFLPLVTTGGRGVGIC